TYAFYVLYANIDKFNPLDYKLEYDKLSVMDKWMLSRLNTLVKTVDSNLNDYKITETARVLSDFIDELSNWYVRCSRERFWAKGMPQDKINAYMTLYTTIVTYCKVAAPMLPFMTEDIYLNLVAGIDANAPKSIHLCDFPVADEALIDADLEAGMEKVLEIVVLGRSARNNAAIKNRQPLANMYVKAEGTLDGYFTEIIKNELNVQNVSFVDNTDAFLTYSFKPQLRTLGRKFGKDIGRVKEYLASLTGRDAADAMKTLKETGSMDIVLDGVATPVTEEDLLIESAKMPGFEAQEDKGITVILDTTLTPELIEAGFVRELISRIQTMRKEAGFEVTDHIEIFEAGSEEIRKVLLANEAEIKAETLSEAVTVNAEIPADAYSKEWDINGKNVTLAVRRV
ncbi:MAG: class I tRNA ligase family protein, partial [Clostridia bacterium]|nr:class I tRNA ligase family protein [Clostridia bacterium]